MLNISRQSVNDLVSRDRLYSLKTLRAPATGKRVARFLSILSVVLVIVLFLPWQQNVRGRGKVTALDPANRPHSVESAIPGRIQKWFVREGEYVRRGDTIMTLSEVKDKFFDPQLLERIQEQIDAKSSGLLSKNEKSRALQRQIKALGEAMRNKIEQAKSNLEAERVRVQNAESQFHRNKKLYESGNIPLTKFQEVEYKFQEARADFENARIEMSRVEAEYLDKISKAESERSNTLAEIFDTEGDLARLRNEFVNMQIRNQQYQVIAPQSGVVVRVLKAGLGETIKESEAICSILPDAQDLAVEMYVKAMDVPLISKGRKVRVMFDGWPAIQFSGWPSVSVGTFGGTVEVIDFVSNRPGEFRILVIPDQADQPWPKQLRMGSGTKGWVMLNDVPVWFEIWRQLSGFPATLYEAPEDLMHKMKEEKEGRKSESQSDE